MKDWQIRVVEQILYPPFKRWCAIARREGPNWVHEVNAEGDTQELALKALHLRLVNSR